MHVRFSPQTKNMAAKFATATWMNDTTLEVITPGGWQHGDKMDFQVTFNGEDYDHNGFEFTFYNIDTAFPRSGPSNGLGGNIIISG